MGRQLGHQTVVVLKALVSGCKYGFEIVSSTGSHTATVYRSLRRLEKLGFVRSQWENASISEDSGRPRRRYYTVNKHGAAALEQTLDNYRTLATDDESVAGQPSLTTPESATA
jgi:PadR family transcriptional regulator PadR